MPPSSRLPRPGQGSFDPWCLTDPAIRAHWRRDRKAIAAIRGLWQYDPDPEATLAIQDEIDAALARGDIAYATAPNGRRIGHYFCCPWSAIYVVKRPVMIGGHRMGVLQQCTYDASAEGVAEGDGFKREVLVSSFQLTERIDYCDPNERVHDD